MATFGYLHVALMHGPSGLIVASEMHGRLLQSGMYAQAEKIKVAVVGDKTQLLPFLELLSPYGKYSVEYFSEDVSQWEWPTLHLLKKDCDAGLQGHVWYMHTKGASQAGRQRTPYTVHVYKNVAAWRGALFSFMATVQGVPEGYGAAGPFLRPAHPVGPHFSGNFWWATADHVRMLAWPSEEDLKARNLAETWIGTGGGPLLSLSPRWDPNTELYGFDGTYPLGDPLV